jgi:16S rRNA A1518/A1519 N6-dimethyltransferase RsmA/KsgA/DIM1 with predicted DNA glycosylase/AP lyase activity
VIQAFDLNFSMKRLVASPGSKEFGRLSVMVQQLCDVRTAFTILGKSFVPAPDVWRFNLL